MSAALEGQAPGTPQVSTERTDDYMDDGELRSIIQREIDSSLGWTGTRIAESRRRSLNEYFGNARGDERDGRSQVVTRDSFEQIEQALPAMMEIFMSGPEVVRFMPSEKSDEDAAEQQTDSSNQVFRESGGFMVLYTMFKDAFIQKNGLVKTWYEESGEAFREDYEGKSFNEFHGILADPDFEIEEVRAWMGDEEQQEEIPLEMIQANPQVAMNAFFDVVGQRVNNTGRIRLENIPPEEFLINRDARSLDEMDPTCRFVGHRVRTSESQLISWGFDPEIIRRLPTSQSVYSTDQDAIIRASQDDAQPLVYSYRSDPERTVYVTECYVRVDRDRDGISEWWKVVAGGDYGQVLLHTEQSDGHPFSSCTPIPIPHRFYGLSLADVLKDLQNINTSLWRQYLDSLYLQTDPRSIVLSQGVGDDATPMCNLDQLVNAAPGMYIEEYTQGAIRPFETKSNAGEVFPAFEQHEKMKQNRTGISPDAMGVNPDAISKHVYGAMVQTSAAQQRLTLFARIFAETGVKSIFKNIVKLLQKHNTRPYQIRLRGEWVDIDPTQWKRGLDCQITVGLGHGTRFEKAANAQNVGEIQKALIEGGYEFIVTPKNLYNTATVAAEALGFKDSSKFFTDPEVNPPPPPEPEPAEQAIQAQLHIDMLKTEIDRQKLEIERDKIVLEAKKVELDHEAEILKLRIDAGSKDVPFDAPWRVKPPQATMDDTMLSEVLGGRQEENIAPTTQ